MDNRELSRREVECIRKHMIRVKDRSNLKRLRNKLIKLEEYKYLLKQYRVGGYVIVNY